MSGRLDLVLERLAVRRGEPGTSLASALCSTCIDVLDLSGAGITARDAGGELHVLASSGPVMAEIEDLELLLGEGPCIDAAAHGQPVAATDLSAPSSSRWVAFPQAAMSAGARAVFGYPLQIGSTRLGALNLYATVPGPLSAEQHQDSLVLADVTTHALLVAAIGTSPDGFMGELADIGANQMEVHQAAGMVSVQLGVPISHALARLRARAFADGMSISDLAAEVVARRLRFDSDD